jgi:hypothetical protein
MKIGHTIDSNGYLTGDVLEDNEITPDVTVLCPDGFYKPKWDGFAWVEGLTQMELDEIHNRSVPESDAQKIARLEAALVRESEQRVSQNADFQALTDYLAETGVI